MIPWIQIYSNLITHPKTSRLADLLGLKSGDTSPDVVAAGLLVSLWTWAIQNAYNGDLSKCSDRTIAEAARYRKKPVAFVQALREAGWLDSDGSLHDWSEYAHLLIEAEEKRKAQNRERVRKHRKKMDGNAGCNITETPCNAPTIPDHTKPNLLCGGDGERAREASEQELARIGLRPGEYLMVTAEMVEAVERVTDELFAILPDRKCNAFDRRKVFEYRGTEAAPLLRYAFRAAMQAGKGGNWNYIDGIMSRLAVRGITTEEDARAWDERRWDEGDHDGEI
jgi:hypothetical protein